MKPIKFTRELRDVTAKCDDRVKLKCELSESGLTVSWLKDGQKIDNTGNHSRLYTQTQGPSHRLVINQVNSQDAGQYTAVYQQLSTTAKLSVQSKSRGTFHDSLSGISDDYDSFQKQFKDVLISPGHYLASVTQRLRLQLVVHLNLALYKFHYLLTYKGLDCIHFNVIPELFGIKI